MLLEGKSALVTGGAQGIGFGFAERWLRENPGILWLADIKQTEQSAWLAERNPNVRLIHYDQGDYESIAAMFARIKSEGPPLGAAALSAIFSDRNKLLEADPKGIEKTIRISLLGTIYVLQQLGMHMVEAGRGGRIVIVGSPHSQSSFAIPGCLAYNAAKAGCHAAMRTVAMEFWPHKITVNEVVPGWVNTPGERKFTEDAKIATAVAKLPAGRLIEPSEVAEIGTVFLTAGAQMVSGQSYGITGMVDAPWWSNRDEGM